MTKLNDLPAGLSESPQYEALFEMRFSSTLGEIASSVLLANLYQNEAVHSRFPQQAKLPAAHIPEEIRKADPGLTYSLEYSLKGDSGVINIGRRSILVAQNHTSKDWNEFRELISSVLDIVSSTGILSQVERYSLKYTNFIPLDGDGLPARDLLNITVNISDLDITSERFDFRTELRDENKISIIQVTSNGIVVFEKIGPVEGTVFILDCITPNAEPDFIDEPSKYLDSLYAYLEDKFVKMAGEEMIKKYPGLQNAYR